MGCQALLLWMNSDQFDQITSVFIVFFESLSASGHEKSLFTYWLLAKKQVKKAVNLNYEAEFWMLKQLFQHSQINNSHKLNC